jgi:phosphotriesterase-related protein
MNIRKFHRACITPLLSLLLIFSCSREQEIIMSVKGKIPSDSMGITLAHEHILVDFIGADSTGYHRWNRQEVLSKVLPYLLEIKNMGVKTLVECTPAYLGRDPLLLRMLSEQSGLQILTNTGYYGAIGKKALPPHTWTEPAEQLAGRWIDEWKNGIENTGIRPGFIKIAVQSDSLLDSIHEKIVRAAALTHLKTGLTINAHTESAAAARAELKILQNEGVSPRAFIWTHAQIAQLSDHIDLARQGVWVSYDNVTTDSAELKKYVYLLSEMKAHGLLDRVILSHDAGWYDVVNPAGVTFRPYTAILTHLIPALKSHGFTDREIFLLLMDNPRKAYTVRVRKK